MSEGHTVTMECDFPVKREKILSDLKRHEEELGSLPALANAVTELKSKVNSWGWFLAVGLGALQIAQIVLGFKDKAP